MSAHLEWTDAPSVVATLYTAAEAAEALPFGDAVEEPYVLTITGLDGHGLAIEGTLDQFRHLRTAITYVTQRADRKKP